MNYSSGEVKPYTEDVGGKKVQVAKMFDSISGRYDSFNHMMTLGIDHLWRKKAISMLKPFKPKILLDVATGTGDFAISAVENLKLQKVIGVDISEGMLQVGREKMKKKGLDHIIKMEYGDSERLQFEDNYFQGVTVGFGARNFENLELGLSEIYRVLTPGGACVILEPAYPTKFPLKQLFQLYFKGLIPVMGKIFAKDKSAYEYLPNSVRAFPNGPDFVEICGNVGFTKSKWIPLTFGTCSMYVLEK